MAHFLISSKLFQNFSKCRAFASVAPFATQSTACTEHGEKIWVFRHRRTDQVIYSFKERLDGFHDLKQLPFDGKKTKPAKLRKDYWAPIATILFPLGQGAVGRSVFQKLRELKHLHEVAWPESLHQKRLNEYQGYDQKKSAAKKAGLVHELIRKKTNRGFILNTQRANAVADMAIVLAGHGVGNKVVIGDTQGTLDLMKVSICWANDLDKQFAREWSANVSHKIFEKPVYLFGPARIIVDEDLDSPLKLPSTKI